MSNIVPDKNIVPDSHIVPDETLIAFALGELDGSESARVAHHVADCPQCRATIASFQSIRAMVHDDNTVAPPLVTLNRAQAIFRQHASLSQPSWLKPLAQQTRRLASTPALATLLIVIALLYGGVRVAGPAVRDTLPGDTLYPVKTTIEDVRVAVALDDSSRVQAQLSIAQARVTEISALVEQGRYDFVPKTTQDYQEHVQEATAKLGQVLKQNPAQVPLAQKAEQDLQRYESSLSVIQANSPGDVKPQIQQAIVASSAAKLVVQSQLSNIANPSSATPVPLPTPNVLFGAPNTVAPPVTNTLAPAPTVVITLPPSATNVFVPTMAAPTNTSIVPSAPIAPALPTPGATNTTVPPTQTALPPSTTIPVTQTAPTGTSVPATGTPTNTATSVPPTKTPTPTPTSSAPTATPTPTNMPSSTPTFTPSVTATAVVAPANTLLTATLPAITTNAKSPTPTSIPIPTSIPPGPSATAVSLATPGSTVGPTTAAGTPVIKNFAAPAGVTTTTFGGNTATPVPSNPPVRSNGINTPTQVPGTSSGTTLPASILVQLQTSLSGIGEPNCSNSSVSGKRLFLRSAEAALGTNLAPASVEPSNILIPGATVPPVIITTPAVELTHGLARAADTRSLCQTIEIHRVVATGRLPVCDVPDTGKPFPPPIIFGSIALLACLGIVIRIG